MSIRSFHFPISLHRSNLTLHRFEIVMAEKTAHDVVNQVQSVRDPSPTDVSATQPIAPPAHVASENSLQAFQTPSTAADNATTIDSDQNENSVVGKSRAESGEIDLGAVGELKRTADRFVLTV